MNIINDAARDAIKGKLDLPVKSGLCLKAARLIVERAFGWPSHEFYRRVVTETVQANDTGEPWAADAEKSFRSRGLTVPTWQSPRPGDLVFNQTSPPFGHVGVVVSHLGGLYVLENAQVKRGIDLSPADRKTALNLCPLHLWGPVTTIGRLPDAEKPDPAPTRFLIDDGSGPRPVGPKREEFPEVRGATVDPEQPGKIVLYLNRGAVPALPVKP